MTITQYQINKVCKLLDNGEYEEGVALLRKESRRVIEDTENHKLSQEDVCNLYNSLYRRIMIHEQEKRIPRWTVDFMREAVDMYVAGMSIDLLAMKSLLDEP